MKLISPMPKERKEKKWMPFPVMICFSILMISNCIALTYQRYQDKVINIGIIFAYAMLIFSLYILWEIQLEKRKSKDIAIFFRTIFQQANVGVGIGYHKDKIERKKDFLQFNDKYREIINQIEGGILDENFQELVHPAFSQEEKYNFQLIKEGKLERYDMEKCFSKRDGTFLWLHFTMTTLKVKQQEEYSHLCLIEDITIQKELEESLLKSENSKGVLLENLPGMAYRCNYDREWTMQFVSSGCEGLTGYKPSALIGNREHSFNEIILPKYREHLWIQWKIVMENRGQLAEEYEIEMASGKIKWVYELGKVMFNEKNEVEALEGILIDITKQKEEEYKFKYLSQHDVLTDLYNRRYFDELVGDNLRDFSELRKQGAILLVMIQNLKQINITHGFFFSEQIIIDLSRKLRNIAGRQTQIFQIAGDRFALLVEDYGEKYVLEEFATTVLASIRELEHTDKMNVSIGILELKEEPNVDRILKYSSIAAEEAVNRSSSICFFSKELEDHIIRKEGIKNALMDNLTHGVGELVAVYQPILDLRTNRIYGFEALARFSCEKYGLVMPNEFIPIAEESGLIIGLGLEMLEQGCKFLCEMEEKGLSKVNVSVNVSAIQLIGDDFFERLKEILVRTEANPEQLTLELTESIFANNFNEVNAKLSRIREIGIRIAIDDFGTGYSSLARERELSVDSLKIDKRFVDKINNLEKGESITGDIISMAHKLGHLVVAEGVEEQLQMDYLKAHHCNYIQGYLYSKPLTKADAIKKLKEQ